MKVNLTGLTDPSTRCCLKKWWWWGSRLWLWCWLWSRLIFQLLENSRVLTGADWYANWCWFIPDICHRQCLWRKNPSCGEISPQSRLLLWIYAVLLQNLFFTIYALLCGENLIQKLLLWRKNDKCQIYADWCRLMMIDADWCLLMPIDIYDADWYWVMLIGADWYWLIDMIYVKCFTPAHFPIYLNLPEKAQKIVTFQTID